MKGIDHSYFYEGYAIYRAEDLQNIACIYGTREGYWLMNR